MDLISVVFQNSMQFAYFRFTAVQHYAVYYCHVYGCTRDENNGF
jgi:hypothetical protein